MLHVILEQSTEHTANITLSLGMIIHILAFRAPKNRDPIGSIVPTHGMERMAG